MKIKKNKLLSIIIVSVFIVVLCCNCSKKEQAKFTLEDQLLSQIEKESDEYLSSLEDNLLDILTLKSISYGNFTNSNTSELLALIGVDSPHVGGLERTIVAIYNQNTKKLITQKTFIADHVSFYFFDTVTNKTNLLCIMNSMNQGISSSQIQLFEIEENTWIEKEIPQLSTNDDSFYSVSGGVYLHIFERKLESLRQGGFQYLKTLTWDSNSGNFYYDVN